MELEQDNPNVEEVKITAEENKRVKLNLIFLGILIVLLILILTLMFLNANTKRALENTLQPTSITETVEKISPTQTIIPAPNYPLTTISDFTDKVLLFNIDGYHNALHLLVSDSDGKNVEKLIDSGNRLGYVGISKDRKTIYYSELIGEIGTVYKKDFLTKTTKKLFTFKAIDKNIETFFTNAALSPDERYVIYSHNHGDLSMYDLEENTSRILLTAETTCNSHQDCWGYYYPKWSPNNKHVVVLKMFYEGGMQIIINPFENEVTAHGTNSGGEPVWSPDGKYVAIAGGGYGPGSLFLVVASDPSISKNLLYEGEDYQLIYANSAVWVDTTKIAFVYINHMVEKVEPSIAIYNVLDKSIKKIVTISDEDTYIKKFISTKNELIYSDHEGYWLLNINTGKKQHLPLRDLFIVKTMN